MNTKFFKEGFKGDLTEAIKIVKALNSRPYYVLFREKQETKNTDLIKAMSEAVKEIHGTLVII